MGTSPHMARRGRPGRLSPHRRLLIVAPRQRHRSGGRRRTYCAGSCHRRAVGSADRKATRPMTERDVDWQLVTRVQRGDKHAYELLVSKYQRRITRLLSRIIRDPSDIEDVAQEAFIKAYRALPSFRGESAFYTWLYRIAINTAKNHFAAQGRRTPTRSSGELEDAENFEDAVGL